MSATFLPKVRLSAVSLLLGENPRGRTQKTERDSRGESRAARASKFVLAQLFAFFPADF